MLSQHGRRKRNRNLRYEALFEVMSYPLFVNYFISVSLFLICMCFSQDCPTGQIVLHSSAEASTSAFASREGDEVEIIGTKSVKKKVEVLYGIFLNRRIMCLRVESFWRSAIYVSLPRQLL